MKTFAIGLLLIIAQASCKQDTVEIDLSELANWSNCAETYTMAATQQKIIGQWRLIGVRCGFCAARTGIEAPKKNIELRISSNGEATVYEDNKLVATEQLTLRDSPIKGYFSFDKTKITKESIYTMGYIEFCQDKMALRNSYMDGEDYFYLKVQ